jgi:hypothetical protein
MPACSHIGTVRWRTFLRHVSPLHRAPWLAQPGQRCTDKVHSTLPYREAATAGTLAAVCSPHACPASAQGRAVPSPHARALPSLYHRAEPSPSALPLCRPRCPHAMRVYKRGPSPCILSAPHHCLPLVSRRRCIASVFHRSVGAKLPHPTSLPVRRSGSSAGSQRCSQTNSSHIFSDVELRCRRPRR